MTKVKEKLHGRVVYPFKHLLKIGDSFPSDKPRNNILTSYRVYKKQNDITCSFITYDNGTTIVARTA